jgi:hypothetical protein
MLFLQKHTNVHNKHASHTKNMCKIFRKIKIEINIR